MCEFIHVMRDIIPFSFKSYLAFVMVNHNIVGFQISMHDALGVAKVQSLLDVQNSVHRR